MALFLINPLNKIAASTEFLPDERERIWNICNLLGLKRNRFRIETWLKGITRKDNIT